MVEKWTLPYPAYTGEEERFVYVYVPDAFAADDTLRFPVLYMFDGHNVFFDEDATYGKAWGLGEYLDRTQTPLIVAAVECNHDPNNARLSEYSPFTFTNQNFGHVVGRGHQTMEWFVQTLKPIIDERYPTLPERGSTFIAGSSMGGLMSLYALMAYNSVFSRAAALSPSLWADPDSIDELIRTAPLQSGTVLYMDYGAKEMKGHSRMHGRFASVTQLLIDRGVCLTARIVPGGTHSEASWEKQIPFFINTLLYERQH